MSRRTLELVNFRNFGLDNNSNNKLVINNSLEKGKIGNLVILIGANNSGKSNILDALDIFANRNITRRDVTTLSFDENDLSPSISINYQDDNGFISEILDKDNNIQEKYKLDVIENDQIVYQNAIEFLDELINVSRNIGFNNQIVIDIREGLNGKNKLSDSDKESIQTMVQQARRNFQLSPNNIWRNINNVINKYEKKDNTCELYLENTYGIRVIPQIIKYEENEITSNDMVISYRNLDDSLFFKSVLQAIGIKSNEILNAIKQYEEYHNNASLNKIRVKINKCIDKLNLQFNKLYFAESDQYKFSIDVESDKISFGMARGEKDNEDPIMIEHQSTGFKWFFNLYFNFICSNNLSAGDIIIMDEPATNLHPQGQKELRKFIKDFAIKNDLTFIIATHSPFLVDVDNYDELRIVSMKNNRAEIDNLYTVVNIDDPNTLLPIKESLTIQQNVLYDYETEVIWVEGITDYNYLTMFKNFLDVNNIAFLPYNGNGKNNEEMNEIIKKLIRVKFYKKGILVDGDKSGLKMAKLCEDTVFKNRIYKVSDTGEKNIEIEDLFATEDRKKYPSLDSASDLFKKASYSSLMKNHTTINDYSEETINNFKKLFEIING